MKTNPEKYFEIDEDTLEYYETNSLQLISAYQTHYLNNKQQAEKFLSLLIAGVSAIFMLFLSQLNLQSWSFMSTGFLILILGWTLCSMILLRYCLINQNINQPWFSAEQQFFNDPRVPDQKLSLGKIRRFHLVQYDAMTKNMKSIVQTASIKLNLCRYMTVLVLIVALLASLIHYIIGLLNV